MKANDLKAFTFLKVSSGAYRVTYATGRGDYYNARIEDMTLIDNTLHADLAKANDIEYLKNVVMRTGAHYHANGERF